MADEEESTKPELNRKPSILAKSVSLKTVIPSAGGPSQIPEQPQLQPAVLEAQASLQLLCKSYHTIFASTISCFSFPNISNFVYKSKRRQTQLLQTAVPCRERRRLEDSKKLHRSGPNCIDHKNHSRFVDSTDGCCQSSEMETCGSVDK